MAIETYDILPEGRCSVCGGSEDIVVDEEDGSTV